MQTSSLARLGTLGLLVVLFALTGRLSAETALLILLLTGRI